VIYLTGNENPQIEKTDIREAWLPNASCVGCHTTTLLTVTGLDNHFHTLMPQASEALKKGGKIEAGDTLKGNDAAIAQWSHAVQNANLTCTSCHLAHTTITNGKANFYMIPARKNEACVQCHKAAAKGPQDATTLGN
jgi:predicted CXXCH cytochrome family protein